jgi:uncharacterized tellurite resistance protein B-like protein
LGGILTGTYLQYPTMFEALKALLRPAVETDLRQQLEAAVAALLFEMTRMDGVQSSDDLSAIQSALRALFKMSATRAAELAQQASAPSNRLISYFEAVSLINRHFDQERKIELIEQLWRLAYADTALDLSEDHLVRKLSDLMYVPHVQCMLARQRARPA